MDSPAQLVKDRLSVVEVVGQYVQLKKAGRNWSGRCPFHKERTPSFMVSPERGTYMCFGCGEKGDIISFVEKIEGVDFKTALQQLAEKAGIQLPKFSSRPPEQKEKDERLRDICEAATQFFEKKLHERSDVKDYVSSRGVNHETLKKWRVGYAPASWDELAKELIGKGFSKEDIAAAGLAVKSEKRPGDIFDRFRGRIMFPIFDLGGSPIAFSGRFFEKVPGSREEGEPAKYVNSPETGLFKKSRVLYGLNFAREAIRKTDCVLLVEGQFDVVLSHQSGLPIAVAVSGTALTGEHLSLLGRYTKRLVLALDSDAAGLRAGLKAAHMALALGFDVKIPQLRGGKDPAELAAKDPELLKTAVRGSQTAIDFFLDVFKLQARDERAYKKLAEASIVPLIAAIPSKIEQAHFITAVAQRLRVPESAVAQEVAKRPKLKEESEEIDASNVSAPESPASALERTAALLLFSFTEETSVRQRLHEILGDGRAREIEVKLKPEAERLQFEFEALVGERESEVLADEMLKTLERSAVEEDVRRTRGTLADAEHEGNVKAVGELAQKLKSLLRRKEELTRGK